MKIVKTTTIGFDEQGNKYTIHSHCLRCGRRLKTDEAKVRGFGKVCWQKQASNRQGTLF